MYTMNEKVPPTTSNRKKRELAREGDLLTYKRKRKTIDPSTVVLPNTVDTANEGVSEPVPLTKSAQATLGAQAESAQAVNSPQGLEFMIESAQAASGAQTLLPNVSLNSDVNIPIVGGYSEGEGGGYKQRRHDDVRIHKRKEASVNEHGDTPVHQSEDVAEQYDASTSECDLLKETIEQMKDDIKLKRVVDEQCALEFADLPRQFDAKYKNLEEKNTSLEAELRQKSGLEDCNQSLSVKLNKKCKKSKSLKAVNTLLKEQIDLHLPSATPLVLDATLAKKHDDLLSAHEDVKKKLIAKEDF
ncbi:hypothetical protein GIB67_026682, partial [Kingdonia uniflora]